MTLQQRKLRKHLIKAIRNEKKIKLYLLNNHWIKIRKQKERRRRRTFLKLWKAKRLQMMKQGFSSVA
jgi:hypothetical protein